MPARKWICPHCNQQQIATGENTQNGKQQLYIGDFEEGALGFRYNATACLNPDCKKLTFFFELAPGSHSKQHGTFVFATHKSPLFSGTLHPRGASKVFPDYIPAALLEDYQEACLIIDDSPKAAATLIRRCLQGMIRDFSGIKKGTLAAEISALKKAVDDGTADRAITSESVEAIDHVRSIGNIGAHMEKNINVIIPVDPGEARTLVELVEMLFIEWYVAREERNARLSRIASISTGKAAQKNAAKPGSSPPVKST